jgi:Signal peptidase, peptidase S26
MQCPSCEFQNMPGSGRCARCGASLALATAAIDVNPPRAGRVARQMPRFWGLRRTWGTLFDTARRPLALTFAGFDDTNFDLGTMLRVVVPGWAHFYRGRPDRGTVFLCAYLGFLVPGFVLLGTWLGSLLIGLAFGIHVAAAVDAMVGRFSDFAGRVTFSLFCGLGLLCFMYLPIGYLVSRVATPIQITQTVGQFAGGDVLWYNRSADIVPGDVVYYRVPPTDVRGRTENGHAANFVFRDAWINRVVALEGQQVSWKDGALLVDGEPVPWQIRGRFAASVCPPFTVLPGKVLIPPGDLLPPGADMRADTWQRLSMVPRSDVYGRVYFRSSPLSRLSTIP